MTRHGRLHHDDTLTSQRLDQGWFFGATPSGSCTTPDALAAAVVEWLPTTVPNTAAGSLRNAQCWSLDDPPRDFDQEDWWYRLRFTTPAYPSDSSIWLHFSGLATVAEVWLNGRHLLTSNNMFRSHRCEISGQLQHDNELLIRFAALAPLLSQKRPRPRWKAPMIAHQQLRWWRTTVLGRTPGWSPPAAAVGPWRTIWLEYQRPLVVDALRIDTRLQDDVGIADLTCTLSPARDTTIQQVALELKRGISVYMQPITADMTQRYHGSVMIPSVERWWPHTHGDPALYDAALLIDYRTTSDVAETKRIPLGRVGFRKIHLDSTDDNFSLAINDVEIFCRGACWTPPDVVTLNASPMQLRHSLTLMRDAGMNMVRVGGTMVYESDDFLDLCDELGILLWQDCMFANMDFPETEEFITEVTAELQQQFTRLAGHPCLTVVCGNSEAEQQAAMFGAERDRWSPRLFHELIPTLVNSDLPGIPYWPSSAHGGDFPHQNNSGTTSYYGVGAYLRPLTDARRSEVRFASECLAFANIPNDAGIACMPGGLALKMHHPRWKERTPRDLGAGWDFEDVRDFYLKELYRADPLQLRYADHDRYLELSRTVTGEVMSAAFAEWRRQNSPCRGALIWFWQDLWAGAGWGILDADQTPKAAYYYLKRALQPVSVNLTDEGNNGIAVHLHNESAKTLDVELAFTAYRDGKTPVANVQKTMRLASRQSITQLALGLFGHFTDLNHAYRFGPAMSDLIVATLSIDAQIVSEAWLMPQQFASTQWPDPTLSASMRALPGGEMELTLENASFAQSVYVHCPGWLCDDQYFHLKPGSNRKLRLKPFSSSPHTAGFFVKALNSHTTPIRVST